MLYLAESSYIAHKDYHTSANLSPALDKIN